MYFDTLAGRFRERILVEAVTALAVTQERAIYRALGDRDVLGVSVVPDAGVTGDNTNTKNLNVINRGTGGAGATEIGNLDLVTGVNLTKNVSAAIFSGGPAAPHRMNDGEVLVLEQEEVGTGVALPSMMIEIEWRNPARP